MADNERKTEELERRKALVLDLDLHLTEPQMQIVQSFAEGVAAMARLAGQKEGKPA